MNMSDEREKKNDDDTSLCKRDDCCDCSACSDSDEHCHGDCERDTYGEGECEACKEGRETLEEMHSDYNAMVYEGLKMGSH